MGAGRWEPREEAGWEQEENLRERQKAKQKEMFSGKERGKSIICVGEQRIVEPRTYWMRGATQYFPSFSFATFVCYTVFG